MEARGRITLWSARETLAAWRAQPAPAAPAGPRRRGPRPVFSEDAVAALLTVAAFFRLGLRETVGPARSFFSVLALELPVPDHTTLARRRAQLPLALPVRPSTAPLHLVIDSRGLATPRRRQLATASPRAARLAHASQLDAPLPARALRRA
ncbi:MAG TPA: transposase [Gemmatimonadaceae bacterium]|nr:transposase [Gemmatimonadaceae bacterium]